MESPLKPLQLFVERYGTMLTRMDSSKVHDLDDTGTVEPLNSLVILSTDANIDL